MGGDNLRQLLERQAVALERLADEAERQPVFEFQPGPPVCPHCGKFSPNVGVSESDGIGALAEIFLVLECQECHTTFYAVPEGWTMCENRDALQVVIEDKKGGSEDGKV